MNNHLYRHTFMVQQGKRFKMFISWYVIRDGTTYIINPDYTESIVDESNVQEILSEAESKGHYHTDKITFYNIGTVSQKDLIDSYLHFIELGG